MKTSCLASLLVCFASCAFAATAASAEISEITLERTACYGTCPVYKVTLQSDGTVTYDGKEFVKEVGKRSGKISKEQFQQLVAQIQKTDFFNLEDEYRTRKNADGSVTAVTDLPTCITTVKSGARSKIVKNYFGGPESLKTLEDLIDKISGSALWVKGKA
ncbi:MAG: hypothetical protein JWO45_1204 [Spartobacteria bacterium]|nr:hypothetical protein [Spartobacteria bacterium]